MTEPDPIERFSTVFVQAKSTEPFDASRAALATCDRSGRPSVRFVLVKEFGPEGFVVYTNLGSRKARELGENAHAALAFHWSTLGVQVRVEGPVEPQPKDRADRYFGSRPRGSQLSAWASRQSEAIVSRESLEARYAEVARRFEGGDVPRPPFWGGFRLVPARIEFWKDRADRLHERTLYERADAGWRTTRLAP